mgnify:CR=1 FL=1
MSGAGERANLGERLRERIRPIADFPKAGILFRDIMPVLADPHLFQDVIRALAEAARTRGVRVDKVAGIESRGFILAAPLALRLGAGFVAIRKPGKLPGPTRRLEYELEYGTDALEVQTDAIRPGDRVYLVDDVLATGGTAAAASRLIAAMGGEVPLAAFMVELAELGGRRRLQGIEMASLVTL